MSLLIIQTLGSLDARTLNTARQLFKRAQKKD
jgi:hypothetical protein